MNKLVAEVACGKTYQQVDRRLPTSQKGPGYRAIGKSYRQTHTQARKQIVHGLRVLMVREVHCVDEIAPLFAASFKVKDQPVQTVLNETPGEKTCETKKQ